MKIAVYGNCQSGPLHNLFKQACSSLEMLRCPAVHTISEDQLELVDDVIKDVDIVVHQPIGEGYGKISSNAIRERYPNKAFISFAPIYHKSIFPQLGDFVKAGGAKLKGSLYNLHDARILRSYIRGDTLSQCRASLDNEATITRDVFDAAVDESRRRDKLLDVKVMDYIDDIFRDQPTFHVFNHPTNHVLWYVVLEALKIANISVDSGAAHRQREYLNFISAAVPQDIAHMQELNWERPYYSIEGKIYPQDEIIADFYRFYNELGDQFSNLVESNRYRFLMEFPDTVQCV